MRWYTAASDFEPLQHLVVACHPERAPRPPLWWQVIPTLVVVSGTDGMLVAYTQMSVGEHTLYLYDTGVHPEWRRTGWARRLMAKRLMLGARMGTWHAVGYTDVDNAKMDRLLLSAHFHKEALLPAYYTEFRPARAAWRYVSTPQTWMWATALDPDGGVGA